MLDLVHIAGLGRVALLLGVLATLPVAAASAEDEMPPRQREAVTLARQGEHEQALALLAELRRASPDDRALLYEETTVLAWAQRDEEVLANAGTIDPAEAPGYVVKAVAKSARNLGQYDQAAEWYRALLNRAPDDSDAAAGYAMTLAEAGGEPGARASLTAAIANSPGDPQLRLASAYLYERDGAWSAAIGEYDAVLGSEPDSAIALRGKALALRELRLPGEALAIARAHPGALSDLEIRHLEVDELSIALDEASLAPGNSAARTRAIEPLLTEIDRQLESEPLTSPIARRLRYDRIVGMVEVYRPGPAAADYLALLEENADIPAYVHDAAGRAFLQLRAPKQSLAAFDRAAALEPDDVNIEMERFYAYSDLEQYDDALAVADGLVERFDDPSRANEPEWYGSRAKVLAGIGRAYADNLGASQKRLEAVVTAAPSNASARQELANVYLWRGWPDRALEEFQRVLAREPDSLYARIGATHAELDRQNFATAEAEIASMRESDPRHGGVRALDRRWELHNRNEVYVEARRGESNGDTFGSDQYDVDTWWFSSPIKYNYRVFAHTFDKEADFETIGKVDRRRAGAGVEYRQGRWTGRAEGHFDRGGLNEPGLAAWLDRRLSDQWKVGGVVELNSYSTPLRAWNDDIDTDLYGLNAEYRRNESLRLGSGVRYQDYEDGNKRWSFFGNGNWRWLSKPTYKLDLTGSLYGSKNSEEDTFYYNPERDFEGMVGLDQRWRMFRHYERKITHRLHSQMGFYDQESYGKELVWSLDYELTWAANDALEVRFGLSRARRAYDGDIENQTFFLAALTGRF